MKTGTLLVNLGTPDSYAPEDVGRFLKEFLMDPDVITLPGPLRWILVNLIIVPRRKYDSGKNYEKIWMKSEKMSPLLFHSQNLKAKLQELSDGPIELGMRYGNPSLGSALESLEKQGCDQVQVVPMFPQFSSATTGTAFKKIRELAKGLERELKLNFIEGYPDESNYVKAQAELIQTTLQDDKADQKVDHHLLSFHGLPESLLRAQDPSSQHCLKKANCCEMACEKKGGELSEVYRVCYRAQCMATAKAIANQLGWQDEDWTLTFQSRLGRAQWTRPYTSETLHTLADRGVKRVSVTCPAFTTDCIETLEEIGIGLREEFQEAGGEDLILVPCLNSSKSWVQALHQIGKN